MNSSSESPNKYRLSSVRLMDQVREALRFHHYGYRTEQSYTAWIKRFIKFNDTRHPNEMGNIEIHLAVDRNIAAATHLLENGTNIRVVQKLPGHADVKTTEIYTHLLQNNLQSVINLLELLRM